MISKEPPYRPTQQNSEHPGPAASPVPAAPAPDVANGPASKSSARGRWLRRLALGLLSLAALAIVAAQWGNHFLAGVRRTWEQVVAADEEGSAGDGSTEVLPNQFWTCGMHPWVILPEPGLCPICHMDLTPLDPAKLSGEIAIDPVMVQNIGVRVAPVTEGPLRQQIRTVGTVGYDETTVRDVNTKIPGWIEKLYADETGRYVQQGDPLFELYSPDLYQAQSEYLVALRGRSSISSDLQQAARTKLDFFDITPEQVQRLAQQGQAQKTLTIASPHTGIVIEKNAHEGMKIEPGTRVYRIADLSTVWVTASFYEYQLPYLAIGQPVRMTLPHLAGKEFQGRVAYIYPYLQSDSRQVKVRLEFPNPAGELKPGMFANVELSSTLADNTILAPREAVISTGKREVAFVSLGNGRFEPREIRTGAEVESGLVQVLEGLEPGEMVVTSGQFLLDSESKMRSALAKMVRGTVPAERSQGSRSEPAVALAEPPVAEVQQQIDQLVRAYLVIQQALAADQAGPAAAELVRVRGVASQLARADDPELAGRSAEVAKAAAGNRATLEELREAFKLISESMVPLVQRTPPTASVAPGLQVAYCSMAEASWLQAGADLANPYMGAKMLTCGEVQQTIRSRSA